MYGQVLDGILKIFFSNDISVYTLDEFWTKKWVFFWANFLQ
jgi:hypothetical protein